jgi:hypothetical protein
MYYFLVYDDFTHYNFLNKLLDSIQKFGKKFKIIIFNKK